MLLHSGLYNAFPRTIATICACFTATVPHSKGYASNLEPPLWGWTEEIKVFMIVQQCQSCKLALLCTTPQVSVSMHCPFSLDITQTTSQVLLTQYTAECTVAMDVLQISLESAQQEKQTKEQRVKHLITIVSCSIILCFIPTCQMIVTVFSFSDSVTTFIETELHV
jgi:hypothetical protein